ncbi:MAG: helix-turn-helix domain-containing protein [Gemmataceae bacterium]
MRKLLRESPLRLRMGVTPPHRHAAAACAARVRIPAFVAGQLAYCLVSCELVPSEAVPVLPNSSAPERSKTGIRALLKNKFGDGGTMSSDPPFSFLFLPNYFQKPLALSQAIHYRNNMKSFSDQIRDAIKSSCVTRYVLAGQAGIAESVLSRFMSGKQGMSLSTLDKIAEVLGLQVRVGVQEVRKSRKPGRPKKEEAKMQQLKSLTSLEWGLLAQNAAKDAHEKNFPSRRGLYVVEGGGIVYYDNNPFKLPREKDRREDLILQFRAFLERSKLQEKACAYYPTSGESKDYTFAMVIQAEGFMLKAIRFGFLEIVVSFVNGWHEGIDLGYPADGDT